MVKKNIVIGFSLAIGGFIALWLWRKFGSKAMVNPVASPYGTVSQQP